MGSLPVGKSEFSGKNQNMKLTPEIMQLWHNLAAAVERRDLFWVFFYADQLSTAWALQRAANTIPVVQFQS